MKKIGVGILGMGTVGGGTYKILTENSQNISLKENIDIEVIKVLERVKTRAIEKGVPEFKIVSNIDDIINDSNINIIVEVIGGIEPAKTFIKKSLKAGRNVVTANKELIAKHWDELEKIACENNVGLYFEASCLGGIPIIRSIVEGLQANNINEIMGIFNGTTNYILTKMTDEKMSYSDALAEAQKLGYAEADPTSDVEGFDAAYKLGILSTLAFRKKVPIDKIYRQGISGITQNDIENGRELGYTIKLLAIGKFIDNTVEVRVHPAFVPIEHPLASVRGSFNAVHLVGNYVGELMLYGRGAGDLPTGSAIVSDIIYCANLAAPHCMIFLDKKENFVSDFTSKYYMLISCVDKPGVLAKTSAVLGDNNVSIDSIIQRGKHGVYASVLFLTHNTSEKSMMKSIAELQSLDVVDKVESVIRVI